MSAKPMSEMQRALAAGVSAYLIWGLSPLYFLLLDFANPFEIVMHRIVWAIPVLALVLLASAKLKEAMGVLKDQRTFLTLLLTAALISVNWWLFIYAVNTGHVLQASLGYYINPLMSVAIGVLVLREPLGPYRIAAISLAAIGVANQIITVGVVPWISLALALSFAAYGYLRKTASVDGRVGLFWETSFNLPVALVGLLVLNLMGLGQFQQSPYNALILMTAGAFTVAPLLLYTIGVRGLHLSTMGLLQFIAPSLQFAIGITRGEAFTLSHLITFAFIWAGVAMFAWSTVRREKRHRADPAVEADLDRPGQ